MARGAGETDDDTAADVDATSFANWSSTREIPRIVSCLDILGASRPFRSTYLAKVLIINQYHFLKTTDLLPREMM